MLYSLKGKVLRISETQLCLDFNGMVFEFFVPKPEAFSVGKDEQIFTYLHWNQENGPTLFGFHSVAEKQVFLLIISCSGIGPKMALAILGQLGSQEFVKAVQDQDIKILSSVSGIGAKKAEQIAVQLKHKVEKVVDIVAAGESSQALQSFKQLRQVLGSLNYSSGEINSAVEFIRGKSSNGNFDQMLRGALGYLSKSL